MIGDTGRDQVSLRSNRPASEHRGHLTSIHQRRAVEYAEGCLRDDEIDTASFCAAIHGKPLSDNDNDLSHDEPSPRTQAPPAG
jgi:hypothetical protein